jgi:hypothetical protein
MENMEKEAAAGADMGMVTFTRGISKIQFAKHILDKRDWLKYRVYPDWHARVIDNSILRTNPGMEFNKLVDTHVNAYIFNKVMPPAQIATAIMNIADDYINGREAVVRSGDYIALQNYAREIAGKTK